MSDNESEDLPPPDKFGKFLMFGDEIAPVFDALTIEQAERRKLDAVRIEKTIIGIDRLNVALDVAIQERIESDQLIEKLNITRLDAMQRKLVHQIETGYQGLQDELDEAKERLRIATEKLYQTEVDAEIQLVQMREEITAMMDLAQERLLEQSQNRLDEDLSFRHSIPAPVLESWRILQDEKNIMEGGQSETRERLMPLEHSDLNDIESSVAQQNIRQEISELLSAIARETRDRIEEEKALAAKARSLTDALTRGLQIVNRNYYGTPLSTPVPEKQLEDPPAA